MEMVRVAPMTAHQEIETSMMPRTWIELFLGARGLYYINNPLKALFEEQVSVPKQQRTSY